MKQTHTQSARSPRAARRTHVLALASLLACAPMLAACDEDNAVIITYRPVAAFNGYVLTGYAVPPAWAGDGNDFVYYRIASITNKGKDAKPFTLDYSRIWIDDDDGSNRPPMTSPLLWDGMFPAHFVGRPFTAAPGQTLTFPMGQDSVPRFIIWQTEGTGYQRVRYHSKGAPQPVSIVIEPGAAPEVVDGMDSHHLQIDLK